MHSKTRYNIRLAGRKGVEVKQEKNLEVFWRLYEVTTKRNFFKIHPKSFCEKLLKQNFSYQLSAYYGGMPLASSILIKHLDTLYYFFGASGDKQRNVMAPYLMHWEIIKLAKKLGCKYYDFWGMSKPLQKEAKNAICFHNICWDSTHPVSSVTRFKAGFGGEPKVYPEAYDVIINPFKYKLYNLVLKLKGNPVPVGHPKNKKPQISF